MKIHFEHRAEKYDPPNTELPREFVAGSARCSSRCYHAID